MPPNLGRSLLGRGVLGAVGDVQAVDGRGERGRGAICDVSGAGEGVMGGRENRWKTDATQS